LITTLVAALIAVLSAFLFTTLQKPKIAYVRSQELIYNYMGTLEAQKKYESQQAVWQANIDTLKATYEQTRNAYKQTASSLSTAERQKKEQYLMSQQQQITQYIQAVNEKSTEEDERMMQGTLYQINSFVERYGKAHGYDIILGTTLSGNVLYGKQAIDITDELLKALNENYQTGNDAALH